MSDTKHYFIHCDYRGCDGYIMGDVDQPPSAMRRSKKLMGEWLSRKEPPTKYNLKYGIPPTAMQDFCPAHHPKEDQA